MNDCMEEAQMEREQEAGVDFDDFELIYEEDDLVVNKLSIVVDGFEESVGKDFISIWAVDDSDILVSKPDIFHLIASYDKGHKRIVSQGMFICSF